MIDTAGRVSIVIPCYNEARRLNVQAFRDFFKTASGIRLLFVDDGSTDGTFEVLQQLCNGLEGSVQTLKLERNQGKAEAVRRGILWALDQFDPSIVGFWDADLATPLETIPRFLQVLEERPEIEMIFGARVQLLGRHVQRSAVRHYLGRIFATAVSAVLNLAIYDTQCGAKLFRVGPETRGIFAEPFLSKWAFDVEILARYERLYRGKQQCLSKAVFEYPLESWVDVAGSKVRPTDFFLAFWDIVRIRAKYLS